MIPPTYYHPGGDWWISAMRQMWHWVAILSATEGPTTVPEQHTSERSYTVTTGGNE